MFIVYIKSWSVVNFIDMVIIVRFDDGMIFDFFIDLYIFVFYVFDLLFRNEGIF